MMCCGDLYSEMLHFRGSLSQPPYMESHVCSKHRFLLRWWVWTGGLWKRFIMKAERSLGKGENWLIGPSCCPCTMKTAEYVMGCRCGSIINKKERFLIEVKTAFLACRRGDGALNCKEKITVQWIVKATKCMNVEIELHSKFLQIRIQCWNTVKPHNKNLLNKILPISDSLQTSEDKHKELDGKLTYSVFFFFFFFVGTFESWQNIETVSVVNWVKSEFG